MKKKTILLFFILWASLASPVRADVVMHRMYNPNSGEHFYTASGFERDSLVASGWNYEGVGWNAPNSGVPVHRFYNPNEGDHFYTLSNEEKTNLLAAGWIYEGVGWYSGGNTPVLRQYSPSTKTGSHNYTTDKYEAQNLIKNQWLDEKVAWFALDTGASKPMDFSLAPTYYSQKNPIWADLTFNGHTIGKTGCVPMSLAMILNGCFQMNIPPLKVVKRVDDLSNYTYGATGADLVHAVQSYGLHIEVVYDINRAKYLLFKGYPFIFFIDVNSVGHSIVTYGYSAGNTYAYDPIDNRWVSGWVSIDSLWDRPAKGEDAWDAGRPVFAISR